MNPLEAATWARTAPDHCTADALEAFQAMVCCSHVVHALAHDDQPLTLAQITEREPVSRRTVSRHLNRLAEHHLVIQVGRTYTLNASKVTATLEAASQPIP